ncbi:MAG: ExbD/TolR family protein [Nannocystales bacterium]
MASNVFEDDGDVIAEINVVPFVDIVLVLLIVFMLTSSLIARASISVELPRATSTGEAANSTLNISLDADNRLSLNGDLVDLDTLGSSVARASWEDENVQAVISADRRVDYGSVIRVIDVVRTNGVKTFALNIERDA